VTCEESQVQKNKENVKQETLTMFGVAHLLTLVILLPISMIALLEWCAWKCKALWFHYVYRPYVIWRYESLFISWDLFDGFLRRDRLTGRIWFIRKGDCKLEFQHLSDDTQKRVETLYDAIHHSNMPTIEQAEAECFRLCSQIRDRINKGI